MNMINKPKRIKEKNIKWATFLTPAENLRAEELSDYLWRKRAIDHNSRYEVTRYCLAWAHSMVENDLMLEKKREIKIEEKML